MKELTLATVYGSLVPSERVIALLQAETDVEKVANFTKAVEAAKHIDSKNAERRNYWGELALWSTRRLGELIREAQGDGTMAKQGRPKRSRDVTLSLQDVGINKMQSQRAQRIADIPEERIRKYVQKQTESQEEITKAGLLKATTGAHISYNSGESEWYTPGEYVEAARKVLGSIDLDPASCAEANTVVKATRFFDVESDGLSQSWSGTVYMNPPYSQPLVGRFCEKLLTHLADLSVPEAIVLVNNASDTKWFQALGSITTALCFPAGRIRFWNSKRESSCPLQGQCILYFGPKQKNFLKEFKSFGVVFKAPR